MNEQMIEVGARLGIRACRQAYQKGGELYTRAVPAGFSKERAKGWHLEAARLIEEELAAEIKMEAMAS